MKNPPKNEGFPDLAERAAAMVRLFYRRGWADATSTNYSFRYPGRDDLIAVSKTGADKEHFTADDFILVDLEGRTHGDTGEHPSSETALHLQLYADCGAGAVFHTHSLPATILSSRHAAEGKLQVSGLEMLKGLRDVSTHDTCVNVPIYPNLQDRESLSEIVAEAPPECPGYLLEGHGLYAYGETLEECKRHVETFEFLFEYLLRVNLS